MKTIYSKEFETVLIQHFADSFGCEASDFQRSNTFVVAQQKLLNSNRVNFYQFPNKGFVLSDPNHFKKMKQIVLQNFRNKALQESDVNSFFGDKLELLNEEETFSYLDPSFFVPQENSEPLRISNLTKQDANHYEKLKESCSIYEWEEAYIYPEHGINFGLWQENTLLGLAGIIDWDGIFSDISIIIHPEYRKKGLGKMLLSVVCHWGIEHEKLLQFRNKEQAKAALKLLSTVGFKPFMTKLSYRFTF